MIYPLEDPAGTLVTDDYLAPPGNDVDQIDDGYPWDLDEQGDPTIPWEAGDEPREPCACGVHDGDLDEQGDPTIPWEAGDEPREPCACGVHDGALCACRPGGPVADLDDMTAGEGPTAEHIYAEVDIALFEAVF